MTCSKSNLGTSAQALPKQAILWPSRIGNGQATRYGGTQVQGTEACLSLKWLIKHMPEGALWIQ